MNNNYFSKDIAFNFYTNFTNLITMEDRKDINKLDELKKELQVLSPNDSLKVTGGKTVEKDKWNSGVGSITPQ
jgi:hypothetical protein